MEGFGSVFLVGEGTKIRVLSESILIQPINSGFEGKNGGFLRWLR